MVTSRRDVLKATGALAGGAMLFGGGIGAARYDAPGIHRRERTWYGGQAEHEHDMYLDVISYEGVPSIVDEDMQDVVDYFAADVGIDILAEERILPLETYSDHVEYENRPRRDVPTSILQEKAVPTVESILGEEDSVFAHVGRYDAPHTTHTIFFGPDRELDGPSKESEWDHFGAGDGGSLTVERSSFEGYNRIHRSVIAADDDRQDQKATTFHELGHSLNEEHVEDKNNIMYHSATLDEGGRPAFTQAQKDRMRDYLFSA